MRSAQKPVLTDPAGNLGNYIDPTSNAIRTVAVDGLAAAASITDGRKVVTTAGTRVQLSSTSVPCRTLLIVAETDNTGTIVVGGTTVVASLATRQGVPLAAGDGLELLIDNLNDIWLDSTVNGDGVTYIYMI